MEKYSKIISSLVTSYWEGNAKQFIKDNADTLRECINKNDKLKNLLNYIYINGKSEDKYINIIIQEEIFHSMGYKDISLEYILIKEYIRSTSNNYGKLFEVI